MHIIFTIQPVFMVLQMPFGDSSHSGFERWILYRRVDGKEWI